MKLALVSLLALATPACTIDENLGDHTAAQPATAQVFGAPRWALTFASPQDDYAHAARFDSHGDVVVAGAFTGTVDFGGSSVTAAASSGYLTKRAAADGAELWTHTSATEYTALLVDADDSILAAGAEATKLTPTGELAWSVAPAGDGQVFAIAHGPGAGWYASGVSSSGDGFVALLGPDGTVGWVRTFAGHAVGSIALAPNGDVVAFVDATQLVRVTATNQIAWLHDRPGRSQGETVSVLADGRIVELWEAPEGPTANLAVDDANGMPAMTAPSEGGQLSMPPAVFGDRVIFAASIGGRFAGVDVDRASYLGAWDADGTELDAHRLAADPATAMIFTGTVDVAPSGAIALTAMIQGPTDFGTGLRPFAGGDEDGAVIVYDPPPAP